MMLLVGNRVAVRADQVLTAVLEEGENERRSRLTVTLLDGSSVEAAGSFEELEASFHAIASVA